MATPNYSYEKRQRELAKKRKTEEKRQKKTRPGEAAEPVGGNDNSSNDSSPGDAPPGTPPR